MTVLSDSFRDNLDLNISLPKVIRWDFNQKELEKFQRSNWTQMKRSLMKVLNYSFANSFHMLRLLFRMYISFMTSELSSLITDSCPYLNHISRKTVKLNISTNVKRSNNIVPEITNQKGQH